MAEIIPNWHPIFVNFTVALLSSAVVLYVTALVARNASWRSGCFAAARWNLTIGIALTVATVATGLQAYYSVGHDSPSHAAMTEHRNWAFVTGAVFLLVGLWHWFRHRAKEPLLVFALALVIAGGLLAVTGWKGAELVFRHGLGVLSLPQPEGAGHDHSHDNGSHDHGDESSSMSDNQGEDTSEESGTRIDHDRHPHDGGVSQPFTDGPEAIVEAFHAALSSGDRRWALTLLAPDVLIFEGAGAERSRDEYAGHHMDSDMAFLREMTITVLERKVHAYESVAWIVTTTRTQGVYKGKKVDLSGTETAILEQRSGEWRIVHIHWSSRPMSP